MDQEAEIFKPRGTRNDFLTRSTARGRDRGSHIGRAMKVYESAKILTNVQTFRDCALHQWCSGENSPAILLCQGN